MTVLSSKSLLLASWVGVNRTSGPTMSPTRSASALTLIVAVSGRDAAPPSDEEHRILPEYSPAEALKNLGT
jgi:hypothetical protein